MKSHDTFACRCRAIGLRRSLTWRPHITPVTALRPSRTAFPDELLPGLADLMSLLAVDAPSGDVDFEPEKVTPERLAHMYARHVEQGQTLLTALAIHEATGTVAAHSDLEVDASPSVAQLGTYVHREHRGHRLGMAVKVANLQRLQGDCPGRAFVRTFNEENNQHMVSINVDLGFEVVETMTEWTIDVRS